MAEVRKVRYSHNAAFVQGTETDPKIVMFDFDCRHQGARIEIEEASAYTIAGLVTSAVVAEKAIPGFARAKLAKGAGIASTIVGAAYFIPELVQRELPAIFGIAVAGTLTTGAAAAILGIGAVGYGCS